MQNNLKIITKEEILKRENKISDLMQSSYPAFALQDNTAVKYWNRVYSDFLDYQTLLLNGEEVAAVINAVPVYIVKGQKELPKEGWDWVLEYACQCFDKKIVPNVLVGLSVAVNPKMRGLGIGKAAIARFKEIAKSRNLDKVLIPVRPTRKSEFPKVPFEEYINKKENGRYFDPWLNLHYSVGGRFVNICERSMLAEADLKTWKEWIGMDFKESGEYEVAQALAPIKVDKENNKAVYIEPNVWIEHRI